MKRLQFFLLIIFPIVVQGQSGFKEGFLIDKSGTRYEGFLKFEPGNEKQAGRVLFKESRTGKKEVYGTDYVKAFKIEKDSFTVLKEFVFARQKTKAADFAKVLMVGSGGVVYSVEYVVEKSSGHATTEYKALEENTKYLVLLNGKLVLLAANNFTALANVVADCTELKTNITNKKRRYADLQKVIEEYRSCKRK